MVGKKSGKALLREEGLERTDNNLELTTWPQVNMINQKNYYTDYLKRDDQYLAYRYQNEDARNRMIQQARDKDRALAGVGVASENVEDSVMEEGENSQTPEAAGAKLIIIHPGSQNLRIGLGTDALPKTVPMCIARKWKENEAEEGDGEPSPKRLKVDGEVSDEPETWFGDEFGKEFSTMSSQLKVRMRTNKTRLLPNSKELVLNYNKRTRYEEINEHNDTITIDWTEIPKNPKDAPDFIAGQEALRIPENSKPRYKVFWPLRHGWFNERDYETKTQLWNDITVILEQAIESQLGVSELKDLSQYSCVFIIPDLYERVYVTSLLHLLIHDIGFGRVCFQQESLAATFGAGYSNGCIVDIGHQKTSVCCVDEGLCIEDSRVNIKIGGADVTDTFLRMTLTNYFPYHEINLKMRYDVLLAEELKQKICTMQESDVTTLLQEFHLRAPGQLTRRYTFKTYDEPMLSSLGYFNPVIFDNSEKLQGRRKFIERSYDLYDGSPNDPFSAAQETVVQWAAGTTATENGTATEPKAANPAVSTPLRQPHSLLSRLNEAEGTPRSSVAGSPVPENTPQPADSSAIDGGLEAESGKIFYDPALEKIKAAEERDKTLPVMPIDMAIIAAITQGARGDERKMRDFFGGIMLVGGGCKISGIGQYLESRLRELRPGFTKEILIGPPPRELDPSVVAWKGGSVFGKLSSSGNDSWISQKEYDVLGSRLLVHKCMFPW